MKTTSWLSVGILSLSIGFKAVAVESPLGLAESKEGYKIDRANATMSARPDTLTAIQQGDKVRATAKPVRIQLTDGGMVLLNQNATAQFAGTDKLNLESGDMLVTVGDATKVKFSVDDLVVAPLEGAEKKDSNPGQRLAAISRPDEKHASISGFNQPVVVMNSANGRQLGVLGHEDTMDFVKDSSGWKLVVAANAPPSKDTKKNGDNKNSNNQKEEKKRRGGAYWWAAPLTIAGIGGATALIIYESGGDHDNRYHSSHTGGY